MYNFVEGLGLEENSWISTLDDTNTTENLKTTELSKILNMFSAAYKRDHYIDKISTKALEVLSRQTEADPATYNESSEDTLNNALASICKSTLEDLKYNEVKNIDQTSLPSEDQNDSEITERIPSLEKIKCSDVNYNIHTQAIHLLKSSSLQQQNERSSLNNIYSENMHKNGSYKKKHLVQKTAEIGVRHWSSQEAATKRKNFGENMFNVTQQIKQEAEKEEMIASDMTEDIQCSQIAEANTLMYQQDFSANHSSSSEIHDHLQHSLDTKDKHIFVDITVSEPKFKNKKFMSKSQLCRNIKSLKNVSSPDEKSDADEKCPENRSISSSFDDCKFKTENAVLAESACLTSNIDLIGSLNYKPMVYSGEVSKVPFVAINNALSNYLELSKQDNELKSKSLENISASLGVKKKQNDIKTLKMVAKYVSISGMSPVASSGIYSTAKICDKKAQTLGSSSLRSTPLILPPINSSVGNTEVTKSITATQSSSLELALPESSITSLSLLSSLPELNISNTSQSTTASAVNISAQEVENKGSIHNPENQKVLNEDISSHAFSTNAIASKSSTENNKLNLLLDSGAVWTEDVMVRNKRKQRMVKADSNTNDGNEIKCTERPSDHDIKSSIVEIEQKYGKIAKVEQKKKKITKVEQNSKKTAKASWNRRTSNQQNCRIVKSKDSIFPGDSTNKLDILNKTTNPHLRIDHRMIDNLKPKHLHNESKSKLTESNIIQQDLSGKPVYSDSTSQEITSSPSQISVESDKKLQEATFMPNEVNVDSNLYPSVSNFPSTVNDHYLTKDTQRYAPHFGTTSSFDPRYFSAEHDHLRKLCYYSAGCNINIDKGFNYFATNNETSPLQGRVSTSFNGEKHKAQDLCSSTVQQEVPTSQITNPLSNGGINMFLEDQKFGHCSTEFNTDKFIQKTYSNAPENENNWHNTSKEWEYKHQQLNKVSQNYDSNVSMSLSKNNHNANWQSNNNCQNEIGPNIKNWINNVNIISGKNKHNTLCQTNNNCLNEIGPNIQNWIISREEDNLLNSGRNFHDTVTEPHTSKEQVEGMQKDTQNNENKIIAPINKQKKSNKQHCGKRKHTKKSKGANKTAVKFEYDESYYMCDYCGKPEKYMAVLRRHLEVEHGWIVPPESADL